MSIFSIIGGASVVILAGCAIWLIVTFVRDYSKATGSVWQRALSASRDSATMLWTKLLALGTSLFGFLVWGADLIGDPQVSAKIKEVLTPEMLTWIGIAVVIINAIVRLRTLPPKA